MSLLNEVEQLVQSFRVKLDLECDMYDFQLDRARKTAAAAAQSTEDKLFKTVSGETIKVSDIPRTSEGEPDPEWLHEHCPCSDHEKERANDNKDIGGQYL